MTTFKKQTNELAEQCFAIEEQLPHFDFTKTALPTDQYLRRELYRIRCDINALQRYAEMVDGEAEE